MRTEARMRVGRAHVLLLGTVAGFVPDAQRVRDAAAGLDPDAVALGVPPEDVATLGLLAAGPPPDDLPDPDPQQAHLLGLLARFGPTKVPSPDLEAAFALATARGVPVLALDLDDAEHARLFTAGMGLRHVIRHNGQQRRLLRETFPDARDAYELAAAHDAALHRLKPLRELESARERHMAGALRAAAARHARILTVVPVARLPGVAALLEAPVAAPSQERS